MGDDITRTGTVMLGFMFVFANRGLAVSARST